MKSISFDLSSLQPALKRVAAARSTDEKRPILHWVNVHVVPSSVTLYAADGFRLHFETLTLPAGATAEKVTFCLNEDAVNGLLKVKIARHTAPTLTLDLDENRIAVDGDKVSGSIEWHGYPDVKAVIPQTLRSEITVDSAEFTQAVKTVRVFAHDGANVAQLHITPESFIVYGWSEENGESFNVVKADYTGSPYNTRLGFNCDFLLSYLKNCTPGPVKIQFNKDTQPALLTDSAGFQAVVMPMHIEAGVHVLTPADIRPAEKYSTAGAYVYPDSYSCSVTPAYNSDQQNAPARVEFEEYVTSGKNSVEYADPAAHFSPAEDDIFTPKPAAGALETELQAWYQRQSKDFDKKSKPVGQIILKIAALPVEVPHFESVPV